MEKINNIIAFESDLIIPNDILTNAILCQCSLPVSDLPENQTAYKVSHGNSYFIVVAGHKYDQKSPLPELQRVPYGSKARILLSYIIDQIIKTDSLKINMNQNLYSFMRSNGIHISGPNAIEVKKQLNHLLSCAMTFGIRSNDDQKIIIREKRSFFATEIGEEIFDSKKWIEEIEVSELFAHILLKKENNLNFKIDFRPLVGLMKYPRAMDIYMWLSHKSYALSKPRTKYASEIPFSELHSIFGQQTKHLYSFKRDFKKAYEKAEPFLKNLKHPINVEFRKKNLYIESAKKLYAVSNERDFVEPSKPVRNETWLDAYSRTSRLRSVLLRDFSMTPKSIENLVDKILDYDQKELDAACRYLDDKLTEGNIPDLKAFAEDAILNKVWRKKMDPIKKILMEEFSFADDAAELLSRKIQNYDQKDIDASFALIRDSLREGKVNNLQAFASKALTEKWKLSKVEKLPEPALPKIKDAATLIAEEQEKVRKREAARQEGNSVYKWIDVLTALAKKISKEDMDKYIKAIIYENNISVRNNNKESIVLSMRCQDKLDYVMKHYYKMIKEEWLKVTKGYEHVDIRVREDKNKPREKGLFETYGTTIEEVLGKAPKK